MKKRSAILILIISIIAIMGLVSATVNLISASVNGSSVTFTCSKTVTDPVESLTKVELWTNTTGIWAANYSEVLTSQTGTLTKEVTGIPNGNYNWNCKFFNNTANDAGNYTSASDNSFTINVASNVAPSFTGTIANVEFAEDATKSNAFDLDTYFTDATAMTFRTTGNSSIIVSIAADNQVSFSSLGNWSGAENLTFTASDGSLSNSSNGVFVNVTAINDAPYLKAVIPNQTWPINTNKSIDLSAYFTDVESAALNYTASSVSHITAYFSGSTVTISPESNWTGNTTIIFYANDSVNVGSGNTVYLSIESNASSANQPPSIGSYKPLIAIVKIKDTQSWTFEITKSDPNGNALTVKWQLNGADIAGATSDSYTLSNAAVGNHTLKVIVSDGILTTSHSWEVSVRQGISGAADVSIPIAQAADVPSIGVTNTNKGECGDNIFQADLDENCATCPEDVKCADNEVCTEGICTKKTSSMKAILIVLSIAIAIGGGIFISYRFNTHRETVSAHRGGIIGESVKVDIRKVSDTPVSDVNDFYHKPKMVGEQPRAEMKNVRGESKVEFNDPKEEQLGRFIKEMRAVGHTEQDILAKLKAKGWPSWQVEFALKKYK